MAWTDEQLAYHLKVYMKEIKWSFENVDLDRQCLTWNLKHQFTRKVIDSVKDDDDHIKLMIAPSGAGKTRFALEYLLESGGIYITFDPIFGSQDISETKKLGSQRPPTVEMYLKHMLACRVALLDYFEHVLKFDKSQLLVAQLYPKLVFGIDIFTDYLMDSPPRPSENVSRPVVFDEIQRGLPDYFYHNDQNVTFLGPLVLHLKPLIHTFIWMGTGIQYNRIQSTIEKLEGFSMRVFDEFKDLEPYDVKQLALLILNGIEPQVREQVAEILYQEEMCHGRARFSAAVIDAVLKGKTTQTAVEAISDWKKVLTDAKHVRHPFKFIRDDLGWKRLSVGWTTLDLLLSQAVISYYVHDQFTGFMSESQMGDVSKGIGFHRVENCSLKLSEPAIEYALNCVYDNRSMILKLLHIVIIQPNVECAEANFVFLVAIAIAVKYGDEKLPLKVIRDARKYFSRKDNNLYNTILLPEFAMRSDIVFYSKKEKKWIIAQSRMKQMSGKELQEAIDATDIQNMYRTKAGKIQKGHEEIQALAYSEMSKGACERVIVCAEETKPMPDVTVIAPNTSFQFFDLLFKDPKDPEKSTIIWGDLQRFLKGAEERIKRQRQ